MADKADVLWTDATWNVVTGCDKESAGCKNCYADRDWPRMAANPKSVYFGRVFTDVQCHPERLDQPLRWTRARKIFVNSTSDLFHPAVPTEYLDQVFAIMGLAFVIGKQHIFQVLTKRAERMQAYLADPGTVWRVTRAMKLLGPTGGLPGENAPPTWPLPNVWVGVSVENQAMAELRIPLLQQTPAAIRWLSMEPLLGPVDLEQFRIPALVDGVMASPVDWIVVGGESGPRARPMNPTWVRSLRDQCAKLGVPFMFKQWGAWAPATYKTVEDRPDLQAWRSDDKTLGSTHWRAIHDWGNGIGSFIGATKDMGRLLDGTLHEAMPASASLLPVTAVTVADVMANLADAIRSCQPTCAACKEALPAPDGMLRTRKTEAGITETLCPGCFTAELAEKILSAGDGDAR